MTAKRLSFFQLSHQLSPLPGQQAQRFRVLRDGLDLHHAVAGGVIQTMGVFFSRTAPHGGVIFALKTVKNTGIYGVLFCDKSRLKTVILEQKIEFTSKGYHMLS